MLLVFSTVFHDWRAAGDSNIESVLLISDKNKNFKGLFLEDSMGVMSGIPISRVALCVNQNHRSFYQPLENDPTKDNFVLHLRLIDYNDKLLTLRGHLDFGVARGQSIGILKARFQDYDLRNYNTNFEFSNDFTNSEGTSAVNGLNGNQIILSGRTILDSEANEYPSPLNLELGVIWIPSPDPGYLVIFGLAALFLAAINQSKRMTRRFPH